MTMATIFDIERNSFVDGPGIRTTVFFKGCNLCCAWCHNPESQDFMPGMMFYEDKCKSCGTCRQVCSSPDSCVLCGKCTFYCPADARKVCGKNYTVDEAFNEVIKDLSYYENSGGGVTFSGGECMLQIDFLVEILKKCKENGIHTAVDTAGHIPWDNFEKIMPFTDLFLYDIKLMDCALHKRYTGVENTLILKNLSKLLKNGANVWVRVPVIGGINDNPTEIHKIKEFFLENGYPEKTELLPYHAMGENKYKAISKEVQTFAVPSPEVLEELKQIIDT